MNKQKSRKGIVMMQLSRLNRALRGRRKMWSINPAVEETALSLDKEMRAKFHDIPSYLHQWTIPYGGLAGKRVLDFGCGSGMSAAGAAILGGAELVVGVDINPESRNCRPFLDQHFGIPELPSSLRFEEIDPGQTTSFDSFDCIFSWSVFEHVDERIFASILTGLVAKLRPGGLFFVQISPLYFSPEGSHLWAIGYKAWEHLLNQTANVESDIQSAVHLSSDEKAALLGMYKTLNRITADDLLERFATAGLTLVRQQRDTTNLLPPVPLTRAYALDALSTHQIVALFQKSP
jgi:SAM-dependent methyltransferase